MAPPGQRIKTILIFIYPCQNAQEESGSVVWVQGHGCDSGEDGFVAVNKPVLSHIHELVGLEAGVGVGSEANLGRGQDLSLWGGLPGYGANMLMKSMQAFSGECKFCKGCLV